MSVPPGATILAQAVAYLTADSQLTALAPGGVWPKLLGPATPATFGQPLVIVREVADTPTSAGGPNVVTLAIETHALPQSGRYAIKRAIERAEWLFDLVDWGPCTASMRVPLRSRWLQSLGPYTDAVWHTYVYIGQVRITAL